MPTRPPFLASVVLLMALASPVRAQPWSRAVSQKIDRMAAKPRPPTWRDTKVALRSLDRDTRLRNALGAGGEQIVLGERSGSFNKDTVVYQRSIGGGLYSYDGHMPTKVRWKEQLVMGSKGLQIRKLRSEARPTRASIKAFGAELDQDFPLLSYKTHKPGVRVEHEPFPAFNEVGVRKARLGFFGLFSRRLRKNAWGHLTPTKIKDAVDSWAAKP
jgi:hypothetical protein